MAISEKAKMFHNLAKKQSGNEAAMVQRVARAIRARMLEGPVRYEYEELARAAIAAMREPTATMSASGERILNESALPVWQAMIDAALAEEPV